MAKLLLLVALLAGCTPLAQGENRKVTAWGLWCTYPGACGVGYWHSERGPNVESEDSAKPGLPVMPGQIK